MNETALVKACLEFLHLKGVKAWRNNSGAVRACYNGKSRFIRYGAVGSPDILGCLPGGRLLAVECKTPTGRVRPEQAAFLSELRAAGALAVVVHNLDELNEAIK